MEQKHGRDAEETRAWYERQLQLLQPQQVEQQYRRESEELRAAHERQLRQLEARQRQHRLGRRCRQQQLETMHGMHRDELRCLHGLQEKQLLMTQNMLMLQLMLRHHEEERQSFQLDEDHRRRQRRQEQQVDALQQQHCQQLQATREQHRRQLEAVRRQQLRTLQDRQDEDEIGTMLQLIQHRPRHRRSSADCADELRNADFRVDCLGRPYRAGLRRDSTDVPQDLRVRREPSQPDQERALGHAIDFHDTGVECGPEDAAQPSQVPMFQAPTRHDQQSLVPLDIEPEISRNDDSSANEAAVAMVPSAAVQERDIVAAAIGDNNDRASPPYPDRTMHRPRDGMFADGSSRTMLGQRRKRRRSYEEPEELREPRVRLPMLMAADDDNDAVPAAIPAERLREEDDEANELLTRSRNFVPRYRRLLRRASRSSKRRLVSQLLEFLIENDQ